MTLLPCRQPIYGGSCDGTCACDQSMSPSFRRRSIRTVRFFTHFFFFNFYTHLFYYGKIVSRIRVLYRKVPELNTSSGSDRPRRRSTTFVPTAVAAGQRISGSYTKVVSRSTAAILTFANALARIHPAKTVFTIRVTLGDFRVARSYNCGTKPQCSKKHQKTKNLRKAKLHVECYNFE